MLDMTKKGTVIPSEPQERGDMDPYSRVNNINFLRSLIYPLCEVISGEVISGEVISDVRVRCLACK